MKQGPSTLSKAQTWLMHFGMPVVTAYHMLCSNVFLNTAAEDAHGWEKMGNTLLTPFRYLFVGQVALLEEGKYELEQYFDYRDHLMCKSIGAILVLPFSLVMGSALKGLAFLSSDTRLRHQAILDAVYDRHVISHTAYYRQMGIDVGIDLPQKLQCMGYKRRPEDSDHLKEEKQAFFRIVEILKENQIPFWADCGTCLGAYRYGGVIPWDNDLDIAVLQPDFTNVKQALNALDRSLYLVEDWSSRLHPKTYIRVYIRSTREYIDVYHFAILPEEKMVEYILSNEDNMFLTEGWKERERRFKVKTPFDVVFPLKRADFEGVEIPVPNQTQKYLQMRYGDNLAPAKVYNEETGTYEKDPSHPYWQFAHVH